MILIPEKILQEGIEKVIRAYYLDYIGKVKDADLKDARDVTTGVTINVTQQGQITVDEIVEVTCPKDESDGLTGTYWLFDSVGKNYYVWYETDLAAIDPGVSGRKGIKVSVTTDATAVAVATATEAALTGLTNVTVGRAGAVLTLTLASPNTGLLTNTLIYDMFGDTQFDGYHYAKELIRILKNKFEGGKRRFKIYLGFNVNKQSFPCVNILIPNEEQDPKFLGNSGTFTEVPGDLWGEKRTHAYACVYDLLITSDSQNEVTVLYHFMKAAMLSAYEHFTEDGLERLFFSGRDITSDFELGPIDVYHKTVGVHFFYQNEVISIEKYPIITEVDAAGTPDPVPEDQSDFP